MNKTRIVLAALAVFALSSLLAAQTTVSPQGGAGIFTGAVCVGQNFPATDGSSAGGVLPPPCLDNTNNGQWFTVMNASLKASTTTSLFVSPALVTGLYTNTQTKGGNTTATTTSTASATGSVIVRALLDCTNCAAPGGVQVGAASYAAAGQPDPTGNGVTFDARIQQLTTTLGQAITSDCVTTTTTTTQTLCPPEAIDLILDTTSAHSFNFIFLEVGETSPQGPVHTITIQARLDVGQQCVPPLNGVGAPVCTDVNTNLGSSIAAALFGVSSVTAIPVHLGPGFSF